MSFLDSTSLILASASTARAQILRNAGLALRIDPAVIDEAEVKAAFRAEGATAAACATALAEAKAERVSRRHPGALVIGADQLLVAGNAWFDKPASRDEAREQLAALRGRTHELVSAICVARDGAILWHETDTPRLHMREFSNAFLERYLDAAGDAVFACVGAYRLEDIGAHLFSKIDGDFFSILGLPLLPLLEFLRGHGVVPR